ncbi:hypothetical protein [Phaeobacter gallaeciensis]|nr:hypothetical protein [Phaeobacter gallaeciensis]
MLAQNQRPHQVVFADGVMLNQAPFKRRLALSPDQGARGLDQSEVVFGHN